MDASAEASPPPPVRLRVTCALAQASWLLILRTLLQLTGKVEVRLVRAEVTEIPFPAEIVLMAADAIRSGGQLLFIGLVLMCGIVALLAWRGVLDRHLRRLLWINGIALSLLLPFWGLGLILALRPTV